ncbi:MAG: tRNA (guanine(10)-N(2))-dimethyltransferase [Candidatus Micrarchaeia archaeon]
MKEIREGKAKLFISDKVFFNPKMELCRDVSSLAVGAYCEEAGGIRVVDGLCGSGARGVRYAKENEIGEVQFVDVEEEACKLAERNAKLNGLKNYRVHCSHINDFLFHNREFGWVEIDPFGTPIGYLHAAMTSFRKGGVLSVTATDTAVLCGAHSKACLKIYGAAPIDNEYCHEIGLRILAGVIVRFASSMNFKSEFLLSMSAQHYFKLFVKLKLGAEGAVESIKELGYISHCPKCLNREWRFNPPVLKESCPLCGGKFQHAGPLFLGELWDAEFISRMRKLNMEREYSNKWKIDELLELMEEEAGMPPTYFDLHKLAEKLRKSSPNFESFIKKVKEIGYGVSRTHFKRNSIRTDATVRELSSIF